MNTALSRFRQVERAQIYKQTQLAGELIRRVDGTEFHYTTAYLQMKGPAVASTLPLSEIPVISPAGSVPVFFAGLLPEGRRLTALRNAVHTSADDEFSLLLAVGSDTIGDVRILPLADEPLVFDPVIQIAESWSELDFSELFRRSIGDQPDRVALPGVQEKVSGRMVQLPIAAKRGSYLLKLNPPELPFLVENEAFFLKAAKQSGLRPPQHELVYDRKQNAGLLIYRFDRQLTPDGQIRSLAFEDGCQVAGRYPADKYRLSTEEVMTALAGLTAARLVALAQLFEMLIFAALSGNGDLHARNMAVLRATDGEWRVSPAFDLPCTYMYGDTTLALRIGNKERQVLTRRTALELADTVGLPDAMAKRIIDRQLAARDGWAAHLHTLPFSLKRRKDLTKFLENRRQELL